MLPLLLGCVACDEEAVLALVRGSFACSLVLCLFYVAVSLACDGEAVLALVRGSFTCSLVLCLSYVAVSLACDSCGRESIEAV